MSPGDATQTRHDTKCKNLHQFVSPVALFCFFKRNDLVVRAYERNANRYSEMKLVEKKQKKAKNFYGMTRKFLLLPTFSRSDSKSILVLFVKASKMSAMYIKITKNSSYTEN